MNLLYVWLVMVFVLGAVIGSFLNVCIARLPLEKSLLWPLESRCGRCFKPVWVRDNIPLLSYWLLRGRCRHCGAKFSIQYFVVEMLTALGFVELFYLIVVDNVHELPVIATAAPLLTWGIIPYEAWVIFSHHASLFSFLMIVACCDLNQMEIPLSVTLTGTFVGLLFSVAWPWPWPYPAIHAVQLFPAGQAFLLPALFNVSPEGALQPMPFWWPLWDWLGDGGNFLTGLANGLFGMLAGTFLLRAIRMVFGFGRGVEGLGLGDADLMMMTGAFLGWQPMIVAFFLSVFPALVLGVGKWIITRNQALPFGPALAGASLCTCVWWHDIDPYVRPMFINSQLLVMCAVFGGGLLFVAAVVLRWLRGTLKE
jgi:leader peptidase (prepilin peptidase)/N-methyltransferase